VSDSLEFVVNGRSVFVECDGTVPLLTVLRDHLGLRGTKFGSGWEDYPILRFSDIPEIEIELIDNPNEPTLGLGEASVGPAGAAIGNALARALGKRIRDLPLTQERIMATLIAD
jgi:nicotinate dehydrogenase subunit B